jgi:glycosyltransferase involved in cell wall biosynthesis
MRVSLVIPCFNEEASLPALLAALDGSVAELEGAGHGVEVIVVDDGSRDDSPRLLREATGQRPWLRVIRLSRNFGQTAAISAGFAAASGEVICPLDADMQNDPADVPLLLAKLDEGYDVVSGWRKNRQDKALTRRLPSAIANRLISRMSGVRLHDYGCTLKAYRREAMEGVHLYGEMHRFIPIYAAWRGARVTEVPVHHHPRRAGETKYGLARVPNVILDLLLARFLWSYRTKPIHVFGKFGLLSMFLGILSFAVAVYFKLTGEKDLVQTPLPLMGVMFLLVGVLSILMGFLAEIAIRTWHEAAASPTYVVREEYRGGEATPGARPKSGGGP